MLGPYIGVQTIVCFLNVYDKLRKILNSDKKHKDLAIQHISKLEI